ncbi:MAG: DUF4340 domain-containing protein [Kiritimatiellae bacterium]|nr:DUF4340 domain-containing protein [Kiritimatiellia bacterium]MCB1102200.1 DUF4340 domain-containing protein [Kiritimatiellia bacterium]
MKMKTLTVLGILLICLVWLAQRANHRNPGASRPDSGVSTGEALLPDLDVNGIDRIVLSTATNELGLVRTDQGWVMETLYGYPADFGAVANFLRALPDLKAGQIMHGGDQELETYGLAAGEASDRIRVTLSGKAAGAVIDLGLIQESGASAPGLGLPIGRFVRINDGPVVLVDPTFQSVTLDPPNWYQQELTRITPDELSRIEVAAPEGAYTLEKTNGTWQVAGLGDQEEADPTVINRLTTSLQYLRADDVLDPSRSDKELGMENPVQFVARTTNGLEVVVTAGTPDPEATRSAIRLSVVADDGGDEPVPGDVESMQRRFKGWTFLVSSYQAGAFRIPRSELVKPVTPASPAGENSALPPSPPAVP